MKTKAYANHSAEKPFEAYTFERRSPNSEDVAIDIKFCGICHSDIHTARSEWGPAHYPCVPGHEIVGTVQAVGANVKKFKVGDSVGVGCLVDSCKTCGSCKEGLEQYCENGFTGTYNSQTKDGDYTKGGYSSHIVVNQNFVLKINNKLNLAAVAPLLCAGITTYSPLKHLGVGKGDKVAIMGLGGLGHMGVQIAAALGAEVTVLSRSPDKLVDAKKLGASHFVLTTDTNQVAKHAEHFDYILDTVSAKHDLNLPLNLLKRQGTLILVGASPDSLEVSAFSLIFRRRKIMGSLIGGIAETQEMLDFCSQHGIVSEIEMIEPKQINDAYERTLKSDVKYRFVMDCQKL
jgi:alcohol dehydrogenase (NADP+)